MIRARRALFDGGHYAPVIAAVAAACAGRRRVLDAGCGEGSYLAAIDAPVRAGIDVSKAGIRLAARRHRDIDFAVASSYRLPVGNAEFDAVLSVFAPLVWAEFARVLRPGGVVVTASPGPDHLAGLRRLLYRAARPHDAAAITQPPGTGWATTTQRVRFDLSLDAADARNLLQMTPYWWSATPAQQASVGELTTAVDILVTIHQPHDTSAESSPEPPTGT